MGVTMAMELLHLNGCCVQTICWLCEDWGETPPVGLRLTQDGHTEPPAYLATQRCGTCYRELCFDEGRWAKGRDSRL